MPLSLMMASIDTLFDKVHEKHSRFRISFVGGGEPLLAWNNVRRAMEYAVSQAESLGKQISFCIITNGSILTEEMLQLFKKYSVSIRVSFDILPDVQETQRGNYEVVARNIVLLGQHNVPVAIRSIITPASVLRMHEMVLHVHNVFSHVSKIDLEPVCCDFTSDEVAKQFYTQFIDEFFRAEEIAQKSGVCLDTIGKRMCGNITPRYCPGDFCVTPEGKITICHRIASENDPNFSTFVYGALSSDGKVSLDIEKYYQLQRGKKAENYTECHRCYARFNCAGGCLVQRKNLPRSQFEVFCEFTRSFLKRSLMNLIHNQLQSQDADKDGSNSG